MSTPCWNCGVAARKAIGCGSSFRNYAAWASVENATYYGLCGIDEARDYLQHPLLGPRLKRATRAVLDSGVALEKLLGTIDAMKFASCMTLFAAAAGEHSVYAQALEGGLKVDARTLDLLKEQESRNARLRNVDVAPAN